MDVIDIKIDPSELLSEVKVEIVEIFENDIVDNKDVDVNNLWAANLTSLVPAAEAEILKDGKQPLKKNKSSNDLDNSISYSGSDVGQEQLILNGKYFFPESVHGHEIIEETQDELFRCIHCEYKHKLKKYVRAHVKMMHRPKKKCPHCPFETRRKLQNHIRRKHVGQCINCDFKSNSKDEMRQHILENHKRLVCELCPDGCQMCKQQNKLHCEFIRQADLKSHVLFVHTPENEIRWFHCTECALKFKSNSGLQNHLRNVHFNFMTTYPCNLCDKQYKTRDGVARHIKDYHERQLLKCTLCEYTVYSKSCMENHIKRHGDVDQLEDLKCKFCSYTTKFKTCLSAHCARHHREKVQCEFCPYQAKTKPLLELHMISKHGKKDGHYYKCSKCEYQTHRYYNLKIHGLKHKKLDEVEYFYCYHCPFKAKRKDNLKTHIFKHDIYRERLNCYICDFKATSKYNLIKHIEMHSRNEKNQEITSTVEIVTKTIIN